MSESGKAVFLSYASQDAEAAKRIAEALRAAGVEVWFDQSELVGGDAWDQKIRKQIKECALLIPIISAATQARTEGYFRLEWRLADQRTHLMAKGRPFLLPVVTDDTRDAEAQVPDSFTEVQWTRLPGGEAAEKFAARVKKLLGGGGTEDRSPRPEVRAPGQVQISTEKPKRWLAPVIGGVVVGLLALVISRPWQKPAVSPDAGKPVETAKPVASLTDAQKLVQRAQKIFENSDELDRETLALADDIVKQALALDAAEPTAWLLGAQLSYTMVWHSFDSSEVRKAELERQASRARALAPDSFPAQLALANARLAVAYSNFQSASNRQDLAGVEQDLRALAARVPGDYQVQRALAQTYRFLKRPDEALPTLQRALDLSGGDPSVTADVVNVLLRRNRYAEAEAMTAPALARRPIGRLLVLDVLFKLQWRGDLAGAQAAIAAWPGWLLREDRGVFIAWQTWLWSRQPERALEVAQRLPRDYLHDVWFTGPRAVLTARAHELAGNREAARADWRTTVRLADQELAGSPEDAAALFWKTWALSRLDDQAGAEATATLLQQRMTSQTVFFNCTNLALLWSTLGRTGLAAEHLRAGFGGDNDAYAVTRHMLELDPAYAPLRADPQFAALAAAALAPAQSAPAPSSRVLFPAPPPLPEAKSVAVLAFANLSDDKSNEYFSDGISEELLNVLAKVPGLKVTARTSSFFFKGKEVPIPEIAKQLGVAYVVEGSVRKQGDKVRITAQLIKAADGFHAWSDTFTRDLKDIFAVQDEIAALIAQNLKLSIGLAAPIARRAVNPEAHQLVLEGRHFWNLRTPEGFDRAEVAFNKAIALDPEFAQAHAGLADVRWIRMVYACYAGANAVSTTVTGAATERALALDPSLAEAYPAAGAVLHWTGRLAEAEQVFKKAIALNPNYALAHHWYSLVLEDQGRLDEALAEIEQAIQLDPLSISALSTRHRYLLMAGRISAALEADEKVQALRPGFFFGTGLRAQGLLAAGRSDEALVVARSLVAYQSLDLRWVSDASAVYVLRALGHEAEAQAHIAALLPRLPADSYLRGLALVSLDRWDEAEPFLERTPQGLLSLYFWNPLWDRWRDDPRFGQLMEKLHCAAEYRVARETLKRMQQEEAKK